MIVINYWAVIVAAIVQMVLGFLWYGPLFGKPWMAMMGIGSEKVAEAKAKGGMEKSYAIMAIGALFMSWALAHAILFASPYLFASFGWYGVCAGLAVGFMNWLGFIAPVTVGSVLWEGRSWKLWLLNTSYWLVGLCIMGAIIAAWM